MPDVVFRCILILRHGLVRNSTSSYSNFARYTFWRSKNTPLYLALLVLRVCPVVELLPLHLLVLSLLLELFYSLCLFQSFFLFIFSLLGNHFFFGHGLAAAVLLCLPSFFHRLEVQQWSHFGIAVHSKGDRSGAVFFVDLFDLRLITPVKISWL